MQIPYTNVTQGELVLHEQCSYPVDVIMNMSKVFSCPAYYEVLLAEHKGIRWSAENRGNGLITIFRTRVANNHTFSSEDVTKRMAVSYHTRYLNSPKYYEVGEYLVRTDKNADSTIFCKDNITSPIQVVCLKEWMTSIIDSTVNWEIKPGRVWRLKDKLIISSDCLVGLSMGSTVIEFDRKTIIDLFKYLTKECDY